MSISIVIRAFNEEKHIGRLLFGITQQTYPNPEIILVDSGSTDATLKIASQYPVKIVHIKPENFTIGRSLNMGVAASSGDYVVLISAHCYPVYPDWLELLTKPFHQDTVALCYGKQRGGETNHYSEHQFFRKYFPDNTVLQQAHPFSHNANAAIRRKLWESHPYDESLTGLEDLAWSSWAMESGHEVAYVAEAEVVHLHYETMPQVFNRYKREAIALKQILPNSSFSFGLFLRKWLGRSLYDLNQARRERVFIKQFSSILRFRFMQYWGTYRGYHYAGKIDSQLHRTFYYPPEILENKIAKSRGVEKINYYRKTDFS
ncbi:MAG: glycosyltransferase family 2 protein [Chloroflexi bacterium]|nr:glycosyltransferase family 2 protein [Chloroflexota bacterium]